MVNESRRFPLAVEINGTTWHGERVVTGRRVLQQTIVSTLGSKSDAHSYSGARITAMETVARIILAEIVHAHLHRLYKP